MTLKKNHLILFGIIFYIFAASTFFDGSIFIKLSRVFVAGLFFVVILLERRVKIYAYYIWLLAFALMCVFSCLYAKNVSIAKAGAITMLVNAGTIISFLGLCYSSDSEDVPLIAMKALAIVSVILGLYVFGRFGVFVFLKSRFIESNGFNSNTLGLHSAVGAVLALWILIQQKCKPNYRWIYYVCMAMNLAFVVLTSSRKALVLLPVSLGLYYLLKSESWLKLLGKVLVVIAIVAVLWIALTKIPFLYNLGGNRLEQLANTVFNEEKADGSTAFRFQLVEWGIDWFKQKPVLGYGADNYRVLVGHLDTWAGAGGTYAHNNFIELLVDVGLVGFIIYYSMYFDVLRRFRKVVINKNSQKLIMGCIFIALFISEYGIVSYNDKYIQLFYAIAWFTMCCPEKEENRIV